MVTARVEKHALTGPHAWMTSGVAALALWALVTRALAVPLGLQAVLVLWALLALWLVPLQWLLGATIFIAPLSLTGVLPAVATVGPVRLQFLDVLLVCLIARAMAARSRSDGAMWMPAVLQWLMLYAGTVMLSTLWMAMTSPDPGLAGREVVALARFLSQALLLVAVVNVVGDAAGVASLQRALAWFGALFAATIWLQGPLFRLGLEVGAYAGDTAATATRFGGLLGDTSRSALVMLFFVFLAASGAMPGRARWSRAAWLVYFSGALLLTGTRGVLPGLAAGWAAFVLLRWRRGTSPGRLLAIHGGVFAGCTAILLALPRFRGPFARLAQTPWAVGFENRLIPMADSLRVIAEHPWLGVGYGGGAAFQDKALYSVSNPNQIWPNGSYNVYLEAGLNGGVLGLLAFGLLVVATLQLAYGTALIAPAERRPLADAAFVFLVALLVGTQTESWLLPGETVAYLFWVIVGLTHALAAASEVRTP
jgi:O-antigen ligase